MLLPLLFKNSIHILKMAMEWVEATLTSSQCQNRFTAKLESNQPK